MALTRSSYSGTWDISAATTPPNPSVGTTLFVNADGSTSCLDKTNNAPFACQLTLDPATGAFTYSDSGGNATGTMTFLTGTGTGLSDTTNLPLGRR